MTACLAALFLAAALSPAAELYRVAGIVINAQTGAPLPHARVYIYAAQANTPHAEGNQTTGEDGRFSFDVPAGMHHLMAGKRNAMQEYGIRAPDVAWGSAIVTGPGHDTTHVVFRWFPSGAISGRVVDQADEPVEGALVQLLRSSVNAGRRITGSIAWDRTDDRGEYRFGGLPGSTYYLAVTGRPWYVGGTADPAVSLAFIPAYYPGATDSGHAAPLRLKPGEEAHADFTLGTVPAASVKITYEGAPSGMRGHVHLRMDGIAGVDGNERTEWVMPPGQVLHGVVPGRYVLLVDATSGNPGLTAQQPVEVSGADAEVKITLHPPSNISGTVQVEGTRARGSMYVSLMDEAGSRNPLVAAVHPDGSFSFPAVPPGRYRAVLRGSAGYFAAQMEVAGADFRTGIIDIIDGASATLRINASRDTGHVGGFVMRGDQPAEGIMVVLAPISGTDDWSAYHGYQTESDGSFDYPDVPAGDYFLLAVDDPEFEYASPAVVCPYFAKARRIHVDPRGLYSERISIAEPAGR